MKGSRPFPKLASNNGERPITANLRADSDAAVNRGKDFPFWCMAGWWWQTSGVVRTEGAHGVATVRGKARNPRVP
ncbi:hypothetical protein ES319_D12G154700v1 [Gossypium barbadense]|uniref:Uncharacterized protein n=2 Tax=Gossypium TaxID=3633 RepID=A0A5J5NYV5_GOSBA|nr:hypothetical protein ES319_D12G154700v1 [Gossypium barbadense]TYG41287.1 hypothetical protein ES288_D12G163700v1 [Gossypium darwinii]